jgi:uncharacterized lipoprotein YmbA
MKRIFGARLSLLLACTGLALSGCGSSPPVSFFTLPSVPPAAAVTAAAYSVVVGPVTVPEMIDRPQLVLRASPTRVEVTEQARWAAPLKTEIPRVIAEQLAQLLPGAITATSFQRAIPAPDYRVLIDIQRFDSTPGEGAAIEASWTVRGPGGALVSGQSAASEPAGAGYDELVAAHGRALNAVSRDVAAAITKLRGGP